MNFELNFFGVLKMIFCWSNSAPVFSKIAEMELIVLEKKVALRPTKLEQR